VLYDVPATYCGEEHPLPPLELPPLELPPLELPPLELEPPELDPPLDDPPELEEVPQVPISSQAFAQYVPTPGSYAHAEVEEHHPETKHLYNK